MKISMLTKVNRISGIVTELSKDEIFVFGSNLQGEHIGGAAKQAFNDFGARWGDAIGITGQCYAIPTVNFGGTFSIDEISKHVTDFINFARQTPEKKFLVTPIGCGIAGWKVWDIAPLFIQTLELENVFLPKDFINYLNTIY